MCEEKIQGVYCIKDTKMRQSTYYCREKVSCESETDRVDEGDWGIYREIIPKAPTLLLALIQFNPKRIDRYWDKMSEAAQAWGSHLVMVQADLRLSVEGGNEPDVLNRGR